MSFTILLSLCSAREALEHLKDTILEGRQLNIIWNEVQTPSTSSKLWIRIYGRFLDGPTLKDIFSLYGVVSHYKLSRRNGETRGFVSFEINSATDSTMFGLNGTTLDQTW